MLHTEKDNIDNNFWRHARSLLKAAQQLNSKKKIAIFVVVIVIVVLASTVLQVRLNNWQGTIYDAIGQKNVTVFVHELGVFAMIVSLLLCLGVAQTWLSEMLKIRLRETLTRDLLDEWSKPMRAYRLSLAGDVGANPDQRLHDDTRRLAELSADLGIGLLQSSVMLAGFVGVLWQLSAGIVLTISGKTLTIPGYMVWCAILYAMLGAFFTWLVGNPLTRSHGELRSAEANFRFHLAHASEAVEAAALHGGEAAERRLLDTAVNAVIAVMQRIAWRLASLNWVTGTYGWLGLVVPMIVAAPGYFGGSLSLGGLMMVVGAFYQVQQALRWYIDRFPAIAEWRAMLARIVGYRRALTSCETLGAGISRLDAKAGRQDELSFTNLHVYGPNGSITLNESHVTVAPGERVLITGPAKTGKSIFFKAIAGLWVWGAGTLRLPPRERMVFLPAIPYIPLGALKEVLTYPSAPDRFSDKDVQEALDRVHLARLCPELSHNGRWDKSLSHDEQQRAVLVRILLHKPSWIIHDETLTVFDEDMLKIIESVFNDELSGAAIVGFGRSNGGGRIYHRTLSLRAKAPGLQFPLRFQEGPKHQGMGLIATLTTGRF
jgi:vitamin B12/bleomycin/antimicrobial peptide transport system ATP-binding/permease protein